MKEKKSVDELMAEDWIYTNQTKMQLAPDNCTQALVDLIKKVRAEEQVKIDAWKNAWFTQREATGHYAYKEYVLVTKK